MSTINAKRYLLGDQPRGYLINSVLTGLPLGTVEGFINEQNQNEIALIGSTFEPDNPNINVGFRVLASYIQLDTQHISMNIHNPQIGEVLSITGISADGMAILGSENKTPIAYTVEATPSFFANTIATGTTPSLWTDLNLELIITQPLSIDNYNVYGKVYVVESGGSDGTIDFGIGINGATPTEYQRFTVKNGFNSSISLASLGVYELDGTETLKLYVRGAGETNDFILSVDGSVSQGTFKLMEIDPHLNDAQTINDIYAGAVDGRTKERVGTSNNPTNTELNTLFNPTGLNDLNVFVKDSIDDEVWSCFYNKSTNEWYYEKYSKA